MEPREYLRWVECPCNEHADHHNLGQMLNEVYEACRHDMKLLAWAYHNPKEARRRYYYGHTEIVEPDDGSDDEDSVVYDVYPSGLR